MSKILIDEAKVKLVLEALESLSMNDYSGYEISKHETYKIDNAITAIREALAEQSAQQEAVAYWIPKAEQFCIADPSGRPFAKAWEPLHASPPQRTWVGLTADDLKEPKNGEQWRVEWWNESCRMMLPADMKLDRSVVWKNGTVQFTIKKSAHGIKGEA